MNPEPLTLIHACCECASNDPDPWRTRWLFVAVCLAASAAYGWWIARG